MRPLDRCLARLPDAYQGPGGAVAVVRDGAVLARHAWGYANAERRLSLTPQTLVRLCSITKQFTCALLLDAFPDPSVLDPDVRPYLPHLTHTPGALQLCHNQSGLRDYWAVAMLHGAPAESAFGDAEARVVIGGTRSLQFAPGTRYSYCNQNFRLLSEIVAARAGRSYAELLQARLFAPAGMGAILAADTSALPDGTEGYEGTQATGFRPAVNRLIWTGDAGIAASLDDMIAWERWIAGSPLYARLAAPVRFADGNPAGYGFGLAQGLVAGRAFSGHGGALRGWRTHRLYVPDERMSVVVLFNHMADARAAAMEVLASVLDFPPAPAPDAHPEWDGAYLEPETGLAVRVDQAGRRLRYGQTAEALGGATTLSVGEDGLWMDRPLENQRTRLIPCGGTAARDIAGRYRCRELEAWLTITDGGGALYGGFSGMLGEGRMEALDEIGSDLWALPCPRALDHTPPGDWTLAVRRGPGGVEGIMVGCWLARGLWYER